jgi:hypothetical protein
MVSMLKSVSRKCLINLLHKHNCTKFGNKGGKEIWVTASPHNLIIRLPENGYIPLALVEIICLETLNMGMWEFDYFLGESGVSA